MDNPKTRTVGNVYWFWLVKHDILYQQQSSSRFIYRSRVQPSQEGSDPETGRADCVLAAVNVANVLPVSLYHLLHQFHPSHHAKRGGKPSSGTSRAMPPNVYAFCKMRQPAEHPRRSAHFTKEYRQQQTRLHKYYNYGVVCDCIILTVLQREFSFCGTVFVCVQT